MPVEPPVNLSGMSPEEAVRRVARAREVLSAEVHKVIVGQDAMIDQMLISLFARGHCLTIGVPGLAKTLTVSTLARALHLKFNRIQFTPDLMPSDITGTEIIEEDPGTGKRSFRFVRGPIFANIVLADEINRTPPKTQAALLQSMQEYQVTAGGATYDLEQPFFVMATQNPIEQEGTYPLPEAQLDRFMLSINIGYPSRDEERRIVAATTKLEKPEIRPVLRARDILWIQQLVRQLPATDHMVDYAVDLARATRPTEAESPEFVKKWLAWGAGPRAAQYLILGAKARALLKGRFAVHAADIRAVAKPVLRHRLFTNFNADAEGVTIDQIIERIIQSVKEPSYGERAATAPILELAEPSTLALDFAAPSSPPATGYSPEPPLPSPLLAPPHLDGGAMPTIAMPPITPPSTGSAASANASAAQAQNASGAGGTFSWPPRSA